ncbi:gamma-glutamyltransferase [Methyloligella sp. 2.7D]|uniref:gamma-glutamyltransferase n=1 Tax=unclassified Methyloligella TaxID=2625955 RepID=UPI00157CBC6E|nr:gamma-glutamyltransferase [Methyloligella sp. GL2]QKP76043.1 gamma-glutamyltransferase [Methyloligella sp. GL2]
MQKGVVAAGHPLTAEAAAEILSEGGNAFDAALAGLAMATIVEPVLASLGGGGFLMAKPAGGDAALYDFFVETPLKRRAADETALLAILADFGPATQEFHIGLGASATPGMAQGIAEIHGALCTRPLSQLFEHAIAAGRQGFPLSAFQAYLFQVVAPILTASESAASVFAPNGKLLGEGDRFENPGAAESLALLAEEGPRPFAEGEIAQAIAEQSAAEGGHLALEDLRSYQVARRKPLLWRHRGAELALNPPPAASGALIAYGLAALEAGGDGPANSLVLYRALCATNQARQSHGAELGDLLQSGKLKDEIASLKGHKPAYRGTTHISVIDAAGNAAAVTVSNGEGNGHMVGEHGFMLNNMLGEEDLVGTEGWCEGTRLSSMMAPTVIMGADGSVAALGTGGSNRIRTAVLQVALNLIERSMSLEDAVSAPRMHVEKCGTLSFEPGIGGIEQAVAEAEDVKPWPAPNLFFGGVHAAKLDADSTLEGAGDPRRGGASIVV